MHKVSVILPVYNGKTHLKETIDSILKQEVDLEVLVIDDGSTDGSVGILRSYSDERMRCFYQENSGNPAGPRNRGIKEATGEFIGFCDQDDIWYKGKLREQLEAYEESKEKSEIGLIVCSSDIIDGKDKIINQNYLMGGFMNQEKAFKALISGNFITACSSLVPRKIFKEVGLLNESLTGVDDYDLWLRITEKYGVLTIKEPLCAWRQSISSLSANKTKQYLENEKIFARFDNTEDERIGHGKNLTRIFLSYVLDKNFDKAKKYRDKAREYPLSMKINFLIKMFDISHDFSYYLFVLMRKMGIISL